MVIHSHFRVLGSLFSYANQSPRDYTDPAFWGGCSVGWYNKSKRLYTNTEHLNAVVKKGAI